MLDNGAEHLLLKLEQVFQGREELISSGKLKVCLTASVIEFVNHCFEDTLQHNGSLNRTIEYIKQSVQNIHTLKITRGPTYKFNYIIDISHFQGVKVLQIKNIAIGFISGLQTLRSTIKVVKCSHCLDKIGDIVTLCGYDLSNAFTWPHLERADFSFNVITFLDTSLRLLPSLRYLNLSHNGLNNKDEGEDDEWMHLPEVTYLDLGYNCLNKVPSFSENFCSRITTLILRNNDLESLKGVEMLSNLKTLDVSANCISDFSNLGPLVHLHRLILICCYDNPIFYDKKYRDTVVSCLSPSPRQSPIVLDNKELSVKESYNLGHSLQVDLNSLIPSRPYGTPVDMFRDNVTDASVSSEFIAPNTPEEKRKSRKAIVRQPSIRNLGDERCNKDAGRKVSFNHVETKEDLERLEKLKKDAGEDYLVVRNQEKLKEKKEKAALVSALEEASASSDFAETPAEDFEVISPESPPLSKTQMQEVHEDEESGRMFLVSLIPRQVTDQIESEPEDMFVTVKGHELVEKNIDLKETSRLDLKSLLDVYLVPGEEKVTVLLKFDHVHKERKCREYTMDDQGQCEKFLALLKEFVREPDAEDGISYRQFKCLKCSASYSSPEEISVCIYCGSSLVVEVTDAETTKVPLNKTNGVRYEVSYQDPDLITSTVHHSPVQPDICLSENDTNTTVQSPDTLNSSKNECDAVVSSLHMKSKNISCEESNDMYENSGLSATQNLGQNSPSSAMNISVDGFSASQRMHSKLYSGGSVSPLASSYSSQSGSETKNLTPVAGRTASQMHFSLDSCTDCDHRLKLYLETKLFKNGEDEEFRCMIKCPIASYGSTQGIPSLLVISNKIAYVCKITGFESTRPKEWLSITACYLLTVLRYIEYGLHSQSFRLEFAEQSGCHTCLVGDKKRCEDFLATLRAVAKKACGNKQKPARMGKANPKTRANIRIQVFGVKDESLMFKGRRLYEQAVNFTDPPLLKNHTKLFRSFPKSMSGNEFIDWLISRKEASSFREAVYIGQLLLNAGAIRCFDKKCGSLERDQYYCFNLSTVSQKDETSDISQDDATESTEVDTTIKQYLLVHWKDGEKCKAMSLIITNTHIALTKENHQWPLPRLHDPPKVLSGPQFILKKKQKIIDVTDVELFAESPCEIEIHFRDEDTPGSIEDDRWAMLLQSENSLMVLLEAIKESWEGKFAIDLPVNISDKME